MAPIGTTLQLADTYVLSTSKIEQALHHLQADRLIESRDDTWYVTGPRSRGHPPQA